MAAETVEEVKALRALLQAWEPRVICPQCGDRYTERACGPTHAIVHHLVDPPSDSSPFATAEDIATATVGPEF